VGLLPILASSTLESADVDRLPGFKRRMQWFIDHRPDLCRNIECVTVQGMQDRRLLSVVHREKLIRLLERALDENEFLSPHGIRSLSRYHKDQPFVFPVNGQTYRVDYEPAESRSGLFGGNSNWRGPVWLPINFLMVEAFQRYHHYYGNSLKVEFPSHSGNRMTLHEVATALSRRLSRLFLRDSKGRRAVFGDNQKFQADPHFKDYIPFYEYFHGDTGCGLGASHQTGWTALVAKLLQQSGE
ncbi:MAG: glucosidase, partial [Acidobacteriaceae bacterium]|nr:glucosidase [Acidobacteriaceae bacterium]